jgi:hypothetical protein
MKLKPFFLFFESSGYTEAVDKEEERRNGIFVGCSLNRRRKKKRAE